MKKERSILIGTTKRLKKYPDVSIRWLGWKPANPPIIISNNNTKWLAYQKVSTSPAVEYIRLRHHKYEKTSDSTKDRILFERVLEKDPYKQMGFLENIFKAKGEEQGWESKEKILIRLISPKDNTNSHEATVVVGVTALGIKYERKATKGFLFKTGRLEEFYTDVGKRLRDEIIGGIYNKLFFESNHVVFVDPTPWIENIKLLPLEEDFSQIGIECLKPQKSNQ